MKRGFLLLAGIILLLMAGCGGDNTTGPSILPTITAMSPSQVARGSQGVSGTIQGNNLNGVVSVNLGDGITVSNFSGKSANEVDVTFAVAPTATAGSRTVTIATGAGTAVSSSVLSVSDNSAPLAKFKITPATGGKNTQFEFDASNSADSDGSVSSYQWNFGDSKTGTGKITTHQYSGPGTYQVQLTVTDNKSAMSVANKSLVVANGLAPIARFNVTPQAGDIGTMMTFDASPSNDNDGSVTAYAWKFGDGASGTGKTVQHTYKKSGTFNVSLTVTDNASLTGITEKEVRISSFDQNAQKQAIAAVLFDFFKLYAKLETLTPDQILVGWSESVDCPGRAHEQSIIEGHQANLKETDARVIGDMDIYIHPDHIHANAQVTARFTWTTNAGEVGSIIATHDFEMILEDEQWKICNFFLLPSTTSAGLTYTISH